MINIEIKVNDEASAELKRFGKDAPKVELKILRSVGAEYRKYVRRNYLSGQYLSKRTGETYRNMSYRRVKGKQVVRVTPNMRLANVYHHPGGATITPKNAKVLRWIDESGNVVYAKRSHLPYKPFMTDSFKTFRWNPTISKVSKKVLAKEIKKRFGDG